MPATFAVKLTDIQGIPFLASTIINLEIKPDGKNILIPVYPGEKVLIKNPPEVGVIILILQMGKLSLSCILERYGSS